MNSMPMDLLPHFDFFNALYRTAAGTVFTRDRHGESVVRG